MEENNRRVICSYNDDSACFVWAVSHQIIMELIMASDGLRHHDFNHPNKNCYVIKNMQQQHATDVLWSLLCWRYKHFILNQFQKFSPFPLHGTCSHARFKNWELSGGSHCRHITRAHTTLSSLCLNSNNCRPNNTTANLIVSSHGHFWNQRAW